MQVRLDEAEAAALKGGRRTIEKLEARVSSLSLDLFCSSICSTSQG